MSIANINGMDLYYEVHGAGPCIVLSHGGGSNHLHWWRQVYALKDRYTVVTYDHRGFGASTGREKGPSAFADDLLGLLDNLKIERAALLGQSIGAFAVAGVAARHPDRVWALIVSNSPAGLVAPPPPPGLAAGAKPPQTYLEMLPKLLSQDAFPTRHPEAHFLFESMAQLNSGVDVRLFRELAAIQNDPASIDAAGIPTLFIGGAEDQKASAAMKQAGTLIRGSRFEMIPDAGHLAFFESPELYNRVVSSFLDEHVPRH